MLIGEVAGLVGVSTKALRHWHRVGLLPEPDRSDNGYRHYPASTVVLAQLVGKLQDAGLPLARIRTLLAAEAPAGDLKCELSAARAEVALEIEQGRARLARIDAALGAQDAWATVTGRATARTAAEWDATLLGQLAELGWGAGPRTSLAAAAGSPRILAAVTALGELFDRAADDAAVDPRELESVLAQVSVLDVDPQLAAVLRAVVADRMAGAGLTAAQQSIVEHVLDRDAAG